MHTSHIHIHAIYHAITYITISFYNLSRASTFVRNLFKFLFNSSFIPIPAFLGQYRIYIKQIGNYLYKLYIYIIL
ncbi:hypothetical protein C2G38_2103552 [Gigaspora rosea]|uniref:Uncharacterized protein n=1 Tax=Gigaspora rosea TaxID=44941 RepID=A0A397UQ81_9GLOM|nr:hypothetical protein C2G38_2103552 [Gigaspora rosea]